MGWVGAWYTRRERIRMWYISNMVTRSIFGSIFFSERNYGLMLRWSLQPPTRVPFLSVHCHQTLHAGYRPTEFSVSHRIEVKIGCAYLQVHHLHLWAIVRQHRGKGHFQQWNSEQQYRSQCESRGPGKPWVTGFHNREIDIHILSTVFQLWSKGTRSSWRTSYPHSPKCWSESSLSPCISISKCYVLTNMNTVPFWLGPLQYCAGWVELLVQSG